jgi:hypothetical protein
MSADQCYETIRRTFVALDPKRNGSVELNGYLFVPYVHLCDSQIRTVSVRVGRLFSIASAKASPRESSSLPSWIRF